MRALPILRLVDEKSVIHPTLGAAGDVGNRRVDRDPPLAQFVGWIVPYQSTVLVDEESVIHPTLCLPDGVGNRRVDHASSIHHWTDGPNL